jgi:hypothetical protein
MRAGRVMQAKLPRTQVNMWPVSVFHCPPGRGREIDLIKNRNKAVLSTKGPKFVAGTIL